MAKYLIFQKKDKEINCVVGARSKIGTVPHVVYIAGIFQ